MDQFNFINWAYECGIAKPVGKITFGTGIWLNKEDLALMLYKYALRSSIELPEAEEAPDYSDKGSMSGESLEAALALSGLFEEFRGTQFSPKAPITRAEAAHYLWRFYSNIG